MKQPGLIRPAVAAEAELLSALAHVAKAHWGYHPRMLAQMTPGLTFSCEDLERSLVLVHESGGVIDGVGAVECSGNAFELMHLWVAPWRMRSGIGSRLMRALCDEVARLGGDHLVIQSDPYAQGFYERLGAALIGTRESDAIPGRHLPLLRLALASVPRET